MKIAVLIYAQPRFLNLTYRRIKEEYDIPGAEVDFFIHFWEDVGFSPQCDKKNNYIVYDNLENYINYIKPKKYKIDNYSELDNLVFLLKNIYSFLFNDVAKAVPTKNKHRYEFGQWFSHKKAYMLMEDYEKENNFKYDIVIKTKSDYIYRDPDNKNKNYIISKDKLNTKFALVSNLQTRKFIHEKNGFKNYPLKEYIPDVTFKNRSIHSHIRYDDINMSATRSAAYYFYNTWTETYLRTLIFDKVNKLEGVLRTNKSQDALVGDTAIYNNIELLGIQRRYIRLYLKDKCKPSWISNRSDISIDVTGLNDYRDLDSYVQI